VGKQNQQELGGGAVGEKRRTGLEILETNDYSI
jgi:hypothetical protein